MIVYGIVHKIKNSPIKIGVASDLSHRLSGIKTSSPWGIVPVFYWKFNDKKEAHINESVAHRLFSKNRMEGEWFSSDIKIASLVAVMDGIYGDEISVSINHPKEWCGYVSPENYKALQAQLEAQS